MMNKYKQCADRGMFVHEPVLSFWYSMCYIFGHHFVIGFLSDKFSLIEVPFRNSTEIDVSTVAYMHALVGIFQLLGRM